MIIKNNYKTASLSSMGVGGECDMYCEINSEKQWGHFLEIARDKEVFILGGGNNVVFGDVFHGVILRLKGDYCNIRAEGTHLYCGGGGSLVAACNLAKENGLSGLEDLFGIPSTIGGGVKGNCGAFLGDISSVVGWVEVTSAKGVFRVANKLCGFGYRSSKLPKGVITKIRLDLKQSTKAQVENRMQEVLKMRKASQPYKEKSCGSIFQKSEKAAASKLIDMAGLKGLSCGGLEVSKKHAGFIVNNGSGTPSDFVKLTEQIEDIIKKKYGILLKKEVQFIGKLK